jgi:hypothetical protein
VDKIAALFCRNGCPTKELRAMTGTLILQQMFNLDSKETCVRFTLDNVWIEALDLGSLEEAEWKVCEKTLYNFADKITKSGLFDAIMDSVNKTLARSANVGLSTQRLDSVHVRSNMAKLNRISLFRNTIVGFLKRLKRKHKEEWRSLRKSLRDRYLSEDKDNKDSAHNFFGRTRPGERDKTLEAMGRDIHELLTMFKDNEAVGKMLRFRLLRRMFGEQCSLSRRV